MDEGLVHEDIHPVKVPEIIQTERTGQEEEHRTEAEVQQPTPRAIPKRHNDTGNLNIRINKAIHQISTVNLSGN